MTKEKQKLIDKAVKNMSSKEIREYRRAYKKH